MSFTFLRSNERIVNAVPIKINANAVAVTIEIPENIGFAKSMNEKTIPNTLAMARFPHLKYPKISYQMQFLTIGKNETLP
mgnify:CR=1 FL=1